MNKLLDRLEEFIIAALMAVATVVAQEFCIILFVWMAKFGAAYGVRTGIHVGVDILINKLSGSTRSAMIQIGLVCGVIFTGLIGIFGALFVWENGMAYETLSLFGADTGDFFEGPTTPDLEWPTWIVYSAVPLGSFLMCYRFLQVMVSFARTGELPTHDHGHVEGLDEEDDENVLLEGEAFSIAEDIEHARREADAKRPGSGK